MEIVVQWFQVHIGSQHLQLLFKQILFQSKHKRNPHVIRLALTMAMKFWEMNLMTHDIDMFDMFAEMTSYGNGTWFHEVPSMQYSRLWSLSRRPTVQFTLHWWLTLGLPTKL